MLGPTDLQPESTGPPVPISDIRIVDPETKRSLPTGQSGLLQVRGPQVMKCYYRDEGKQKAQSRLRYF